MIQIKVRHTVLGWFCRKQTHQMETTEHKYIDPKTFETRRWMMLEASPWCQTNPRIMHELIAHPAAPPSHDLQKPSLKAIREFGCFEHKLPVLLLGALLGIITKRCMNEPSGHDGNWRAQALKRFWLVSRKLQEEMLSDGGSPSARGTVHL